MGHDISAKKPDAKPWEPIMDDPDSDEYLAEFDRWRERTYVACLRRSAGDPFHLVIYRLLGVPEFNAGVSGDGGSKTFTRQDILRALDRSKDESIVNDALREGTEEVHDFVQMMSMIVGGNITHENRPDTGIQRERGFLQATYDWMIETNHNEIEIQFS